ncbi:MAG: hypothetical protein ACK526_20050 [Planctomyces sp.]
MTQDSNIISASHCDLSCTQFRNARQEEPPLDVTIGLDFGTATTKVIVRTYYEPDRPGFAVDFKECAHASSPYLASTSIWISENLSMSLTHSANATLLTDFKYALMQPTKSMVFGKGGWADGKSFDSVSVSAAYLALVIRHSRHWFLENHRKSFSERLIRWNVSLGLPSENYDNGFLCGQYLNVCGAAWMLSMQAIPYKLTDSDRIIASGPDLGGRLTCVDDSNKPVAEFSGDDNASNAVIGLLPEVVAEVAGYANSFRRRNGLHLLIDIGASTVDICSFILHERDGEDRYEMLTALVELLGTSRAHEARMKVVRTFNVVFPRELERKQSYDAALPLPSGPDDYLPNEQVLVDCLTSTRRRFLEIDDQTVKECRKVIAKVTECTRRKRDPNSKHWNIGLPLFVAGGGRGVALYKKAIDEYSNWLRTHLEPCPGFELIPSERPMELRGTFASDFFSRLSVAWGLTFPIDDIGQIGRPSEISNV